MVINFIIIKIFFIKELNKKKKNSMMRKYKVHVV